MTGDVEGLAPPPFDAAAALTQLQRALRDMRLIERQGGFELRGKRVLALVVEGAAIQVRLARKPALTPEWDRRTVQSAADQRRLIDDVKARLARWDREE